jgi:hypothetical protein
MEFAASSNSMLSQGSSQWKAEVKFDSERFLRSTVALTRIPRSGLVQCRLCRMRHSRHSFAVGTLLRWYRARIDPMARLLDLSTFESG